MKGKFLYVFGTDVRDRLIAEGYTLLRSDEKNKIFIFNYENENRLSFSRNDFTFVLSDVLMF